MKPALAVTLLAASLFSLPVFAQQAKGWEGEWGEFHAIPNVPAAPAKGAALTISDCTGNTCKISALVHGRANSHCEAEGSLNIQDTMVATAHLMTAGQEHCSLTLLRSGDAPASISVEPAKEDCASYYCTAGAGLTQKYDFRSAVVFSGDDPVACFTQASPALAAICSAPKLAALEKNWRDLAWEVEDLGPTRFEEQEERTKLLASCDHAPDAAACLDTAFHASIEQLGERKTAWLASVTLPGDETEAARQSEAVNGRYVHSFRNGEILGDNVRSTDTMNLVRLNADSISYAVDLNFFNGHSCSRKGVATWRKGGLFVDQTRSRDGKSCYFEIIPTEDGVKLGDPNGACKLSDCGEHGSYTDAGFSFHEKVQQFSK